MGLSSLSCTARLAQDALLAGSQCQGDLDLLSARRFHKRLSVDADSQQPQFGQNPVSAPS